MTGKEIEMAENKLNFTKGNIDSLLLPEKGYRQYYDTDQKNLILRIYASGTKTFYFYRKIEGKPEYILLRNKPPSRYPDMTPEQARQQARELRNDIGKGKNPAEDKRVVRDEMTLGDLFTRYLDNHAKVYKRTWQYDENMFRLYFSHWEKRPISTITRHEIQALHARMGAENGKPQANRAYALLRTVFEKGLEWGWGKENPASKVKKFREESRERYIEEEELPAFFKAVMAEPSEMERDFLLMLLFTGARKSNVLGMNWKDVNLDMRIWTIPAAESKNGSSYTVPLVSFALDIIGRRKRENTGSPWVFPSASKSGHLVEPKKAWSRVLKASKLEDLRPHDLRRTLGTWMAATGSPLLTVAYALGHKIASLSVTAVYARASLEPIRQAMETAVRTMLCKGGMITEEENIIKFKASV